MGQVYKAFDDRLSRDVAIKVTAERFSERFDREVRAVASLNHPNICTVYDVGPNYLVMELVEGPTLADRIAAGPIPFDESLKLASQIADALSAAHRKGVIHRVQILDDGRCDYVFIRFGQGESVFVVDGPGERTHLPEGALAA